MTRKTANNIPKTRLKVKVADEVGPETAPDPEREFSPSDIVETVRQTRVATILALCALNHEVPPRQSERIQTAASLALVVTVPASDWVQPVADALKRTRSWDNVFARSGGNRSVDKPGVGNDEVAMTLAEGRCVLGVSTAPERYLPAALVAAADIRVALGGFAPEVLRAAIRLVTGKRAGRFPPNLAQGLGFDEVVACIRKGSTPRSCVKRLVAAVAAKRLPTPGLADVPFLADAHGYGEAREWGMALAEAVAAHRRGERDWGSIERRNVVLGGPPGTGKTTFARSLAKTLGMPLVATSVPAWFATTNGYLNDVIKKIDEVFAEAAQLGAVLLLDEADAIPNRETCDSRNRDYWTPVVAHILTTLDGAVAGPASRIVIVAATNHPDRLDPALVRPGRLDRTVIIDLPDRDAIVGILRQHLRGALAAEDLVSVATLADGATGADLAGFVAGARMVAHTAGRDMLRSDLVDQMVPSERRSPAMLLAIARHEAAHAVSLEAVRPGTLQFVTLIESGGGRSGGRTRADLTGMDMMDRRELDGFTVTALTGRAADEHWAGANTGAGGGAHSDLARATLLVAQAHGSWGLGDGLLYRGEGDELRHLLRSDPHFRKLVTDDLARLYAVARAFVARNAGMIDRLARTLIERRILGGPEVRRLLAEPAGTGPAPCPSVAPGASHG